MDSKVSKMVELVTWYCSAANLGYDQWNRWDFPEYGDTTTPGECDCSSLVYNEYNNALYLGNPSNRYLALIEAKEESISTCRIHSDTKVIAGEAFRGTGTHHLHRL